MILPKKRPKHFVEQSIEVCGLHTVYNVFGTTDSELQGCLFKNITNTNVTVIKRC